MTEMRTVKRILRIHEIDGYRLSCLFNNGESRMIDFEALFKAWKVRKGDREYLIAKNPEEFAKVKLVEGTLVWENILIAGCDEQGAQRQLFYDLDPIVLYENSELDESRQIEIGLLIKKSRKDMGLTQEQLALRSGTTKHYISRVENNRTGIELSTLKKIIEGGLGRRMKISIY